MHFVYILESLKDRSTYVGFTTDLKSRIYRHNAKQVASTSGKAPYSLVWYACFKDKKKALDFEKYLKHGSGYAFMNKRLI